MKNICVFCGSSTPKDSELIDQTKKLGGIIASGGYRLIYGGAKVGLMGILADSVLSTGGEVIGVIPNVIKDMEVAHDGLTDLIYVQDMNERKQKMEELSDVFIALPGGFGTLDELFEMVTWAQLGVHSKPIGLLNCKGFYNSLISQINTMEEEAFLNSETKNKIIIKEDVETLFSELI